MINAREAHQRTDNSSKFRLAKEIEDGATSGRYSVIFRYLSKDDQDWLKALGYTVEKRDMLAGTKQVWLVSW